MTEMSPLFLRAGQPAGQLTGQPAEHHVYAYRNQHGAACLYGYFNDGSPGGVLTVVGGLVPRFSLFHRLRHSPPFSPFAASTKTIVSAIPIVSIVARLRHSTLFSSFAVTQPPMVKNGASWFLAGCSEAPLPPQYLSSPP